MSESSETEGMHRRRITLHDGRYLIFYTFDEPSVAAAHDKADASLGLPEPEAEPEAEEERRV
jgi:hypothetical protein